VIVRNTLLQQSASLQAQLNRSASRLGQAQQEAITGLKVQKPSDIPTGWYDVHSVRAAIDDQAVYKDNAERAKMVVDTAETALANATDLMSQARERAVQAASETMPPDQREIMAIEIDELREQLLGSANTRIGDRYVFAGQAYGEAAFDDAGAYQGSPDIPEMLIGPDRWMNAGFDGGTVFQGDVDVFQVLEDLSAAMRTDAPSVQALLDDLDTGIRQMISERQKVGYLVQDSEDAVDIATNAEEVFSGRLQSLIGVDAVASYTDLANLKTAYEGALSVSASVLSGANLFDLLR
jgi:flagellar hook-associated protein 3 FlgL